MGYIMLIIITVLIYLITIVVNIIIFHMLMEDANDMGYAKSTDANTER